MALLLALRDLEGRDLTPCGLRPVITWRMVPSLPPASMPWSTTSSARRPSAYSRYWSTESRSRFFCERLGGGLLVDSVRIAGIDPAQTESRPGRHHQFLRDVSFRPHSTLEPCWCSPLNRRGAARFCGRPGFRSCCGPSAVDETPLAGERPGRLRAAPGGMKARAVEAAPGETILGADTTVVVDGEMLAKPADDADALRMLRLLAGRRHEVLTGICLKRDAGLISDWAVTAGMVHADERAARLTSTWPAASPWIRPARTPSRARVEVHREDRGLLLQRGGAAGGAGVPASATKLTR